MSEIHRCPPRLVLLYMEQNIEETAKGTCWVGKTDRETGEAIHIAENNWVWGICKVKKRMREERLTK